MERLIVKSLFSIAVLLCLASWIDASELDPETRYTILGKHISIEQDPRSAIGSDAARDQEIEGDLSSATIIVSRNIADDGEEPLFLEFSRGVLSNGRVVLEGELSEPTLAKISVETKGFANLQTLTMLSPGQVVSFALLDQKERFAQDWLVIVETLKLAKNPAKKFRIVGDLTGVDEERYPMPMVLVQGSKFDERGKRNPLSLAPFKPRKKAS